MAEKKVRKKSSNVITDPKLIDEVLNRAVYEIYPSKKALKEKLLSGERIRLYTGIDPTADFIHMGHIIWMRKLAEFQKLGHEVIFLLGGFTAMIGDPDKKYTRTPLTREQVEENFRDYKKQASKILDFDNKDNPVIIKNNYDWHSKINLEKWLEIVSHTTLQVMLRHDMFKRRLEKEHSIRMHELSYPLLQGYDSVHMNVDLEVGGKDQTFNMLIGRSMMKSMRGKEKFVLTLKLLVDARGAKVGKTTGNAVSFKDSPNDVFGKVMSWTDEMIPLGFELCTDIETKEIKKIKKRLKDPSVNPMDLKKELASKITEIMYGKVKADKAEANFRKVIQDKDESKDIVSMSIISKLGQKEVNIIDLVMTAKLATSRSEAKRLIKQGATSINNKKIADIQERVTLKKGMILKVGKLRIVKIE